MKKSILLSLFISFYVMIFDLLNFLTYKHFLIVITSAILLFILSFISRIFFYLIALFSLTVNSVMLHILFHWGEDRKSLFGRFEVAILSPISEMKDYIYNYITYIDFIEIIYFFLGIVLFYLLKKQKFIFSKLAFVFYIFSMMILAFKGYLFKIVPFNYIEYFSEANSWKTEMIERNNYIKTHYKQNKIDNLIYDKIIIIMGESVNKHHMSIYGYRYTTTPFFDDLSKKRNFYKFDVFAPANQTRYSIPIDFTPIQSINFKDFKYQLSIVSYFKSIGYFSYWLSNQYKLGKYDTYISSIAKEADYSIIHNLDFSLFNSKVNPDEILWKDLEKVFNSHKKEFYIFHLIGSHADYQLRVNSKHVLFKDPKNIQEQYDNTIFYTDYVLKGIFNKFRNQKVLFIYLSDHSEVVNKKIHGHGFLPPYKDEYEIPLIIYSSVYNPRLENLKNLNTKKINIENFYYMLKYISGIGDNNISYSDKVISITPNNIFNYSNLKFYK